MPPSVSASVSARARRTPAAGPLRTGSRTMPCAATTPPQQLALIRAFERDPLATLQRLFRRHGDALRWQAFREQYYLFSHPDHARYVLQEHHRNFRKGAAYDNLQLLLGQGLLNSEGDFWKQQRRFAQPAFHKQRLARMFRQMVEATDRMLSQWPRKFTSRQPMDMHREMLEVALDIVGRTLLSTDVSAQTSAVADHLKATNHFLSIRQRTPFVWPLELPVASNLQFRHHRRGLHRVIDGMTAARRRDPNPPEDLLTMLLEARDETGAPMRNTQLRDEVLTLFIAGHETSANAITWALYSVAAHPEVEHRLREEIDDVLGDRPPDPADHDRLPYTTQVIEETLRLYPPAWAISRMTIEADTVGGYFVGPNSNLVVSPFVIQRHPAFWPDPDRFDPDRFTPEAKKSRPRYAYFPFGGGPRVCIGAGFAMMELQILLVMILQRFRLRLVPSYPVVLDPVVTLRPRLGVRMFIEER